MKPLNRVVASIPPSGIRRFFELASNRADVISLGIGEPDFVTPWRVREAAIYSIEKGYTTYTANAGTRELRNLIAEHYRDRYGASYDPDSQIVVTSGVSEALDIALRALVEPGDEIIVFEPCYVSYGPCVTMAGGTPVMVPTASSDGFIVDPDRVRRHVTSRTKAMLICSPGNPTGAVQPPDVVEALAEIAIQNDLYILADDIYAQLVYGVRHASFAELEAVADRTVILNGLSKSMAMTGWRVGFVCAPEPVAALMLKIHQYTALCAPHTSQMAAAEALRNGESETRRMVAAYDVRRRYLVSALNDAGLPCALPDGAFYVFPSVAPTGLSSEVFAERLLTEVGVAVVPGSVFGPSGEGHVRCSYAAPFPVLEQAVERIRQFTGLIGSDRQPSQTKQDPRVAARQGEQAYAV